MNSPEESKSDQRAEKKNEFDDLVSLLGQIDPGLSSSLLNRLQESSEAKNVSENSPGDSRVERRVATSYKVVERLLEEGRRLKWLDAELTPEALVENYDWQRRWFKRLFIAASVLALLILGLEGLLLFFELSQRSSRSLPTLGIQALHIHSLCMTLSVVIGLPLGIILYRLFPSTNIWRLNYAHTWIYCGGALFFGVGLVDMLLCYSHFGLSHFVTFHAWLGVIFTILLVIELISGIMFYRVKYRKEVVSPGDKKIQFHNFLGECLLPVGLGAWVSGMSHGYVVNQTGTLWNLIGVLSFCLSLISLVLIFHPVFRRRGRPVVECLFNNVNASHDSSRTIVSKQELLSGFKDQIQGPAVIVQK